jgi:hypothetical protein
MEDYANAEGIDMTQDEIIEMAIQGHAGTRDAIRWAMKQEREAYEHDMEVLMNALWKACGDDEEVVNATIESQGTLTRAR